jgi:hypothetical protein
MSSILSPVFPVNEVVDYFRAAVRDAAMAPKLLTPRWNDRRNPKSEISLQQNDLGVLRREIIRLKFEITALEVAIARSRKL